MNNPNRNIVIGNIGHNLTNEELMLIINHNGIKLNYKMSKHEYAIIQNVLIAVGVMQVFPPLPVEGNNDE